MIHSFPKFVLLLDVVPSNYQQFYNVTLNPHFPSPTQVCRDGAWVENKGALLTFHFRETPLAKRAELEAKARELIAAAGFTPAPAHCAIEARPPVEWDKGNHITLHSVR